MGVLLVLASREGVGVSSLDACVRTCESPTGVRVVERPWCDDKMLDNGLMAEQDRTVMQMRWGDLQPG